MRPRQPRKSRHFWAISEEWQRRRRERRDSLHHELVPRARCRLQHLRRGGVDFDFLAQAVDELFEKLAVAGAFVSPHLHEQAVGADGVAGIGDQHLQQAQLELRQTQRRVRADLHGVFLDVEANAPGCERRGVFHAGAT